MADPGPRVQEPRCGDPILLRTVSPVMVESLGQPRPMAVWAAEATAEVLVVLLYIIARQPTVFDAQSNPATAQGRPHIYSNFICHPQDKEDLHRKQLAMRHDSVRVLVPWSIRPWALPRDQGQDLGRGLDPQRDSARSPHHLSPATLKHVPPHCQPRPLAGYRLTEQR